jgi:hypothetical protein
MGEECWLEEGMAIHSKRPLALSDEWKEWSKK